jgi:hypothetical protein
LELAYKCICQFKNFSGGYIPDPLFKEEGREGEVGLERMEGREWEGKKDCGCLEQFASRCCHYV